MISETVLVVFQLRVNCRLSLDAALEVGRLVPSDYPISESDIVLSSPHR